MDAQGSFDDILEAAERYAEKFDGANIGPVPSRHLAIVTCMDCRFDPIQVFDLVPGDVHIIRNAGARVSEDVIRSLIVSTIRLDVRRVAVVHHTQCGTAQINALAMNDHVREKTGYEPAGVDFMLIEDVDRALRDDVAKIAACPYLPSGTQVAGFVFDVETGQVTQHTTVLRSA